MRLILLAAVCFTLGGQQPAAPSPAPTATRDQAILVLQRAQKSAGGTAKLAAIRNLTRTSELVQAGTGQQAQTTVSVIFPRTIRLTNVFGKGKIIAFYDGQTAWQQTPWGVDNPIPAWQVKAAEQDMLRQWENLLLSDRFPERELRHFGQEPVEEKTADHILIVDPKGGPIHLWIDANGRPVKLQYPRVTPSGVGPQIVDLVSELKTTEGVTLPTYSRTTSDGQPYMETRVVKVQYNTAIKVEDISRPDPQAVPAPPAAPVKQ